MKNFLIVGTQRTASSAFAEIIGLHSEITCGWEWTKNSSPAQLLTTTAKALQGDFSVLAPKHQEHMQRVHHAEKTWLGFRRLFRSSDKWIGHPKLSPVLWLDRLEGHLQWIARNPSIHIIHIVRCDNVEWLKSKSLSRANNVYWGQEYNLDTKIQINTQEAIKRLTAKNWVDQRLATLNQSNPYILVYNENFFKDLENENTRVLNFMGLNADKTAFDQRSAKKQSTKSAAEYITNFSALVSELEKRNLRFSSLCKRINIDL